MMIIVNNVHDNWLTELSSSTLSKKFKTHEWSWAKANEKGGKDVKQLTKRVNGLEKCRIIARKLSAHWR